MSENNNYKGLPEGYLAEGIMVDEDHNPLIRIAFRTHRDIITEIGYETADMITEEIESAVNESCKIMQGLPVTQAWMIDAEQIARALAKEGKPDHAALQCGQICEMVIKESVKSYSDFYKNRKKEWLEKGEPV